MTMRPSRACPRYDTAAAYSCMTAWCTCCLMIEDSMAAAIGSWPCHHLLSKFLSAVMHVNDFVLFAYLSSSIGILLGCFLSDCILGSMLALAISAAAVLACSVAYDRPAKALERFCGWELAFVWFPIHADACLFLQLFCRDRGCYIWLSIHLPCCIYGCWLFESLR